MLSGIGVVYDPPPKADNASLLHALARDGVRTIRIEVGWNHLEAGNGGLLPSEARYLGSVFSACRAEGIVPDILLNANDGDPEPGMNPTTYMVKTPAVAGSRSVELTSTAGLVVGYSGLSDLSGETPKAAGDIVTAIAPSGSLTLSRPLPTALSAGERVTIDTFHLLPLYPVGTPQFAATLKGWVEYATTVAAAAASAGVHSFDIEVWNELSFGSRFLDIANYYSPPLFKKTHGTLQPGGKDWTLAASTVSTLHHIYGSRVTVIWGFSNTTFEGTAVDKLPQGTDGQSYHPYHNRLLTLTQLLGHSHVAFAQALPDAPPPITQLAVPESVFATEIKPESITNDLLPPKIRVRHHPPGVNTFQQYITENGLAPGASGVSDPTAANLIKTKMALRNYAFWLNKGINAIFLYDLYGKKATGYGLSQTADLSSSPELTAIGRYARAFAGATPLASPHQLTVAVSAVGPQYAVDPGISPLLTYRELAAVLPFQVTAHRFVVAVYTMSLNIFRPLPGSGTLPYRLTFGGIDAQTATATYEDPISGQMVAAPILTRDRGSITIGVQTTDYPRLLTIND